MSNYFVTLLKVQVGALSKVMHSSDNSFFLPLRQFVDNCVRIVADLDNNSAITFSDIYSAFDKVVEVYRKVYFL